ncbi:MAG: hypothetical protein JWM11_2134 [Planctomycetaceae bacterium]|nr:hypothetical protein [Planctomycetaceae bacterium]
MALQDPIAAYNAANPYEATLLCQALEGAGIAAHVIDDATQAGVWLGGLVPEPNKTQIWIERADAEAARVFLADYERRAVELSQADSPSVASGVPLIAVTCDACGKTSQFSANLKGSVQSCENCGAYLDVGESTDDPADWAAETQVSEAAEEPR